MDAGVVDETFTTRKRIHNDPEAAPWGMLAYDRGALSSVQQEKLNKLKTSLLRRDNRRYLATHPQVDAVVSIILRAVYLHRPQYPKKFIADLVDRSDFEGHVRHYVMVNGSNKNLKSWCRQDVFSCIHPELLTGEGITTEAEKENVSYIFPDDGVNSEEESVYPLDLLSSSSFESLKAFFVTSVTTTESEKKLVGTYKKREEFARKLADTETELEQNFPAQQ